MDMRHDNSLRSNPAYEAWIAEEEAKLRWLITRQPGSRELVYYLIFLLAANGQYTKALVECQRVLEAHPGDVVAHLWKELIHLRWHYFPLRRTSSRQFNRHHRCRRISRHAS
jgi:protein involved in temperature-dependent protein secretion